MDSRQEWEKQAMKILNILALELLDNVIHFGHDVIYLGLNVTNLGHDELIQVWRLG